jgi:hypothetical protein
MNAEALEIAVAELPPSELARFAQWFEAIISNEPDRKVEAEILTGRLDAAGKRADDDIEAGRCAPF